MARTPEYPTNVEPLVVADAIAESRILLGDNRDIFSSIPDKSVDLIVTDPPYAINYRSNRRTVLPKYNHIALDDSTEWIASFCEHAIRILRDNRHMYCFCRWDTYPKFFQCLEVAGFTMKRTLVWVKDNHGSGDLRGDYAPQDEWIIFASKGRRFLNTPRISNVIEVPRIASVKLRHPTEKPIDLLKILIDKSTPPRVFGDYSQEPYLVFDPFMGSGTTGVAATSLGHRFLGIEMNEEYYEVARERLPEAKIRLIEKLVKGRAAI